MNEVIVFLALRVAQPFLHTYVTSASGKRPLINQMLREKCPSGVTLLGPTIGRFFQRYVGGVHVHSVDCFFTPHRLGEQCVV